jgi:uncharacterized repeat protein (TIGR01451 family)
MSTPGPTPPHPARRPLRLLIAALAAAVIAAVFAPAALAADGNITIIANDPPPPAQPTGAASTYTINFSCSDVSASTCGANPVITIPLDTTTTPPMTSWNITSSSSIAGLIATAQIVGNAYVITLNENAFKPGDSDTIQLSVTPPNNITPDGTTWELRPTLDSDSMPPAVAPTPAPGAATASAHLAVSKTTNDGGAVYVVGNQVIYNITARCNPSGSTGNLYLTDGSLVDTLPAGLTFVSATPTPTSVSGQTVTWDYPTTGALPAGCAAGAGGTTTYQLVAQIDGTVPDNTLLTNNVTFAGTPLGETDEISTSAPREIRAVSVPPVNPGTFLGKTSRGPLNIPGLGFQGTYAGNWITPINPRPSASTPGGVEGQYTVTVSYPASGAYTTDLADPVPCLDNQTSPGVYASNAISGDVNGAGSVVPRCQNPAFNPTTVRVTSASLAAAVGAGWLPQAILRDGTVVNIPVSGSVGSSTYFAIPAGNVGDVAAIRLPPHPILTDVSMTLDVFGYGAASLVGSNVLHNVTKATAYKVGNTSPPVSQTDDADLYIQPNDPQLGVHKAFGTRGAGPGGTTALNLTGYVSNAAALSGDVVLTDLLPNGLTWSNPTTSATFSVTRASGGTATNVTATVQSLANYAGTGRTLIRITLPQSAFAASGFYTISPPTNLILLTVPAEARTYNNTGQLFVKGIGRNTRSVCGPGTTSGNTTTPATFQSSDPLDLDGDGVEEENYCSWDASLTVPPSGGPAFALEKTVQGNLDPVEKLPPGIGTASQGGSGVYRLTWSNTGGRTLDDPVVYDVFPYVGDTGVSQSQSTTPRGSQFATDFVSATVVGAPSPAVTIQYSQSTNPCRPEVFPNAANPTCVNDWTSTPPTDPSLVKALRISSTGAWPSPSSFGVQVAFDVPDGYVNTVAWNSAASDASFQGTPLLPAEPPKVGITAPAPPVTPTVDTTASSAELAPGGSVTDTVTVGNTGGASGTLDWSLVGPVPAAADGTCDGLDWSGAATVDSGTLQVVGNGDYTTPATVLNGAGCYSYVQVLSGEDFASSVTSPAGSPNETVLVHAATLTTLVSAATILPGGEVNDLVTLGGTGSGAGTIEWTLLGPIAPAADGTCADLDWSGAATFDSGSFAVAGDGAYTTSTSTPTAVGCYGYEQLLTADSVGGPARSVAGTPGETVLVAQPKLSTAVSAPTIVAGGAVTDAITVTGTGGQPGTAAWRLLGPVAPGAGDVCTGLDWSGAATLDQGTVAVPGDGTYTTSPSTPTAAGCYAYAVTLTGDAYGDPVVSPAGTVGELVLVQPVPPPPPVDKSVAVTITKTASAKTVSLGKSVTYTLTVRNAGPGTATDVTVTDTPTPAMTFVSAKPAQGTCGKGFPLTCQVGTLAPGASTTIAVTAKPRTAGTVTNTAHVTTPDPNTAPPDETTASAKIAVRIPVTMTKTAGSAAVKAGGLLTYTLAVKNPTGATATGVRVCDRLPSGLTYVKSSARSTVKKGVRCWTVTVPPHATKSIVLTTRVSAKARGKIDNTAAVDGRTVVPRKDVAGVRVLARKPAFTG